jgi:hypothetical protein
MEDYQKRLLAERDALSANAKKLEDFIYENPTYNTLSKDKQKLACQQLGAMEMYCRILNERIRLEGI